MEMSSDRRGTVETELSAKRVPVGQWGCLSADLAYEKKYKVGQGSYGFAPVVTP